MPKEEKTQGYITFNNDTKDGVIRDYGTVDKFDLAQKSTARLGNQPSTRDAYDPYDYYRQRPGDVMPSRFRDVIWACRQAYLSVGVVRNVIDLMTDFACEDLKIVHPDKKVEAFFKVWIAKVKLKDAIDEFVRHFLVDGNVVVKRNLARLSKPVEDQWMEKTMTADEGAEKLYVEDQVNKREIPWRFSFLNVAALYWIGGEAARASGTRQLAFRPSESVINAIRTPSDDFQRRLSENIPADVRRAVTNSNNLVPLDMEQLYVAHNKKDSWEDWSPPFLYSVLRDIAFKHKLRQAEMSALDGVINVIRIWKLGDHTNGIFPGTKPIEKLLEILQTNPGGGAIDIVWDSMIEMKDYYPPIDKILGEEKYNQVNRDILIGLGVPEVLIGGQGANFSNSFIQLKTLVEKLNYVRDKAKDWLYQEVHLVCRAMDIPVAPKIRFNQMNLEDENIARKLIVGLLDRNVISVEAVLESYGEDFLIEMERINKEKEMLKDSGVKKLSPLDPKPVAKGQPGQGRPAATQDVSRKSRTPKPVRAKDYTIQALDIVDAIDEFIVPLYMENAGISNARKLTAEQKDEIEDIRVLVLATIKPNEEVTEENILSVAERTAEANPEIVRYINLQLRAYAAVKGKTPTLAQKKRIIAISWADYHS
jgi:hypothetical protein